MFFENARLGGEFAQEKGATAGGVLEGAVKSAWYANNTNSRQTALIESYNRRIEEVHKATGVRLPNPVSLDLDGRQHLVGAKAGDDEFRGVDPKISWLFGRDTISAHDWFAGRLAALEKQYPQYADVIGAGRDPRQDARDLARGAERAAARTLANYRGPAGLGTAASFAGGFIGSLRDPANILTMFVGPAGRAGVGAKELLWMGVKQGLANAAVETTFQPAIAAWRKEAGLRYDASTFAANVGGAAAFGFGLDFAVRGAARGLRRAGGKVPILDDTGGITGWQTKEQALEVAAAKSDHDLVRRAASGDTQALRTISKDVGVINDPLIRAGFEHIGDIEATSGGAHRIDPHEFDASLMQAARHLQDPHEPLPVPLEPLAKRAEGAVDGPEVLAARERLNEGASMLEAATIMRRLPQALDETVSMASDVMQAARQISRLSDEAFDMVASGRADPGLARLVGVLVEAKPAHAGVLAKLIEAAPETAEAARRMVGVLSKKVETRLAKPGGIDDPLGPQAKAQTEILERRFSAEMKDISDPKRAQKLEDAVDDPGASLARNIDEANNFQRLADLMEACKP